jgi:hypothetical protein
VASGGRDTKGEKPGPYLCVAVAHKVKCLERKNLRECDLKGLHPQGASCEVHLSLEQDALGYALGAAGQLMEKVGQLVIVRLVGEQEHLVSQPIAILLSEGFGAGGFEAPVISCDPIILHLGDKLLDSVWQILDVMVSSRWRGRTEVGEHGVYDFLASVSH